MFVLKAASLFIQFFLVPFLIGKLILGKEQSEAVRSLSVTCILGLLGTWALFWVLCLPITFLKLPFFVLVVSYTICIVLLSSLSLWLCIKKDGIHGLKKKISEWVSGLKAKRNLFEYVYMVIFLILLGVQIYYTFFYDITYKSYDDYDYVVESEDIVSKNQIYTTNVTTGEPMELYAKRALNSWIAYIAYLSKVSGFQVTTVAHTFLPVFLLLTAYLVYYYIADYLFSDGENRWIFLILLSMAYIFGYYSNYSLTFRLLGPLWQGKAVLSVIVLPFAMVFMPALYRSRFQPRNSLYIMVVSAAACSLTMMGGGMVGVLYCGLMIVFFIGNRKFTGWKETLCGLLIPAVQMAAYLCMR